MKKLFVILTTIFIGLNTNAQTTNSAGPTADQEPMFHFGVKVAPGLSWVRSDKNSENNTPESDGSLLRVSYGFITDFRISSNYTFSTGIDVNYEGGKLKRQLNDTTLWNEKLKLRYIEIPLTIRMNTNRIGYIKYFFQAGLAPGINIHSRYDATVVTNGTGGQTETDYTDEDVMKDINTFNLSMIVGGGINYNLSGTTDLILGITYHNGFLDVTDNKATNAVLSNSKLNANLLSLNVGILF